MIKMSKIEIIELLDQMMAKGHPVIGVQKKGAKFVFDHLAEASDFTFDYLPTILPLKKFFLPSKEVIFNYDKVNQSMEIPEETRSSNLPAIVYFGVRECDLTSLKLLDQMMLSDPYYREKRQNSLFFAFDCTKPLDKDCFCYKLHEKDYGLADVLLIPYEDNYGLDLRSDQAKDMIGESLKTHRFEVVEEGQVKVKPMADLPIAFKGRAAFENMESVEQVCQKEGDNCFNCGSCTTVCPTCYCFSINDEDQINGIEGQRVRTWDGCRLEDFSLVAGGHRLVRDGVDRAVHRFNRKYRNGVKSHGMFLCVGCGRCSRMCPTGNNIGDMMTKILEGNGYES